MKVILLLLLSCVSLLADTRTNHFVTPSGSGAADGSSWADSWSVTAFNTSGNWGSGEAKITSGECVYFSGGSSGADYYEALTFRAGILFRTGAAHPTDSSGHDGQVRVRALVAMDTYDNSQLDGYWPGAPAMPSTNVNPSSFKLWVTATNSVGVNFKGDNTLIRYVAVGPTGVTVDGHHGIQSNPSAGSEPTNCIIDACLLFASMGDGININRQNTNSALNTIIRNCYFRSNYVDGMQMSGGFTVTNNIIDLQGAADGEHPDGIQSAGRGFHNASGNSFIDCQQALFWETDANSAEIVLLATVVNNLFYMRWPATNYMLALTMKGKVYTNGQVVHIELLYANNTMVNLTNRSHVSFTHDQTDPDGGGPASAPTSTTVRVRNSRIVNNIFHGADTDNGAINVETAVDVASDGSDLLIQTNVIWGQEKVVYLGTDYTTVSSLQTAFPAFTGNTNAAPVFNDYAGGDFTIDETDTAAKGRGAVLSAVPLDKIGFVRSLTAPTIGAFEFQSGGGGGGSSGRAFSSQTGGRRVSFGGKGVQIR
jgi:hypothetical protein